MAMVQKPVLMIDWKLPLNAYLENKIRNNLCVNFAKDMIERIVVNSPSI